MVHSSKGKPCQIGKSLLNQLGRFSPVNLSLHRFFDMGDRRSTKCWSGEFYDLQKDVIRSEDVSKISWEMMCRTVIADRMNHHM